MHSRLYKPALRYNLLFMINFAQLVIQNISRTVLYGEIFQHSLRVLYDCLFIIGIFAPVGARLIKASGLYNSGVMELFVPSDYCFNILKVEFFE